MTEPKAITEATVTQALEPCPFCAQPLFIRHGVNAYGRCETEGCWASERKIMVPLDDLAQVEQWNTRTAASQASDAGVGEATMTDTLDWLRYQKFNGADYEMQLRTIAELSDLRAAVRTHERKSDELSSRMCALLDSQYRAGVSSGWNAQFAKDPNARMAELLRIEPGFLAALRSDEGTSGEEMWLREALADPNAVHVNMLRGGIARPSLAQIIHIYGADALRAALTKGAE